MKAIGQTKDAGFQIGVRKTFSIGLENAWHFMFSPKGLELWLGLPDAQKLVLGDGYKTIDGIEGKVTVLKDYSHVRMSWKKPEWPNSSTLQVRLINSKGKVTISFHQDHLLDLTQRNEMKVHLGRVLDIIGINIAE